MKKRILTPIILVAMMATYFIPQSANTNVPPSTAHFTTLLASDTRYFLQVYQVYNGG